jgi:tRNA-dihydrouridine synthase
MAGLTHSVFRTTLLKYGGVGLLSTEMLSASRLPMENELVSPYLFRTAEEAPLSYQLLVAVEEHLSGALSKLARLGADCVDINLGCPAPSVRRMGGGSALMDDPKRVRRIIACCRRLTSCPLSAKIRLGDGFDGEKLRDFCRMLAGEGLDMLTVHARLRRESFTRRPHWAWIGQVKQWVDIPVIANGGIDSVDAARLCLQQSGADGLMIGRAAAQSPWIFADIAREVYGAEVARVNLPLSELYSGFFEDLQRFRPERRLGRLKEFTHYFARNYFFGHHLAAQVQASKTPDEAWRRAEVFFTNAAAAMGSTDVRSTR